MCGAIIQQTATREERGQQIALIGAVSRIDQYAYSVESQSRNGLYNILSTEAGWICSCPDYTYRHVKCKHVWAVEISLALRTEVQNKVTIQPLNSLACKFCGSQSVVKKALRHNSYGDIQRYLCKACGKRFSNNLGFERMKASPQAITSHAVILHR